KASSASAALIFIQIMLSRKRYSRCVFHAAQNSSGSTAAGARSARLSRSASPDDSVTGRISAVSGASDMRDGKKAGGAASAALSTDGDLDEIFCRSGFMKTPPLKS